MCRNLLSTNRAKGHEALCNRLHPNTLCTSKLIEFQSKRLNALLAFLLSQQQSTHQSDVQYTSTSTGRPINGAGPCVAHRQTCRHRHQSTAPLTRHGTIEVDAYYRFLCRQRPASRTPALDRRRSTPTVARTVSGESPANWQSKERQIANTNNRTNGRNNEANCCRTDFHSHLDCRSDSKAPPQQRDDSLETAAATSRLQAIADRIKSDDSTESAVSCEADADVSASLPPANRTVSVDSTKSLIDAFGASAASNCRRLHGASRQRACCTRPRRHSAQAQQATIEQAIRLTQLVRSSTATANRRPNRSEHSAAANAKQTMNFNAGNASDDKHPHNFQLARQAAHCNALSRQERQQVARRQPQLLHQQQHSQAVNHNYCYSIGAHSASCNNNNPIEATSNGVNNNANSWSSAATAAATTPFGCVDRLIDTFNGALHLTPADNHRGQLPQIILSDFSSSATGPVSTALLFTRAATAAAAVQTLAEHPIVIDTPTTTPAPASIYPPI